MFLFYFYIYEFSTEELAKEYYDKKLKSTMYFDIEFNENAIFQNGVYICHLSLIYVKNPSNVSYKDVLFYEEDMAKEGFEIFNDLFK